MEQGSHTGGRQELPSLCCLLLARHSQTKVCLAQFQLNFSLGQLTAEHVFKFLQDVKTHTKTQRLLPNILERVLEEPAHSGSAATKDTLLGLGRGGMGPTVCTQVTIKCIHSPVQGTTVQCPSLTLLQVSNKKNEVKQNGKSKQAASPPRQGRSRRLIPPSMNPPRGAGAIVPCFPKRPSVPGGSRGGISDSQCYLYAETE